MTIVPTRRDIAARIDHAILSPATLNGDFAEGCRFARAERTASVCVRPCDLRKCAELLTGSRTAASTVIGFPHGGQTRAVKVYEAREAVEDADSVLVERKAQPFELDLVVNIGRVLSGDCGIVRDEISAVCDVTHARGGLLKVILETGYLDEGRIRRLCELCGELGVDFVKTGTGFGPRSASVEDVRLMRASSPPAVKVKASGGIRTLADALALIDAGADRLGTSRTREILDECE